MHSCSNLLEAFHHSYNMYSMLGSERFITPEAYLVPAGLILAALCIQVLPLLLFTFKGWQCSLCPYLETGLVGSMVVMSLGRTNSWYL